MYPRAPQNSVLKQTLSGQERVSLRASIVHISTQIQQITDRYNGLPHDANVLRRLANYHVMLSDISHLCGNHADVVEYGYHAIAALGHIPHGEKTAEDFHAIAAVYEKLAQHVSNDAEFVLLFKFASDFFKGEKTVSFSRFNHVVKEYVRRFDAECKRNQMLLQLMRLIKTNMYDAEFPDSVLKQELQSFYYQIRFRQVMQEQQAVEDDYVSNVCNQLMTFLDQAVVNDPVERVLHDLDELAGPVAPRSVAMHIRFFEATTGGANVVDHSVTRLHSRKF